MSGPLARFDALVGDGLETRLRTRHRRRLERTGRLAQLDPPEGGSPYAHIGAPPRAGSELEPLIDGERALAEIARAAEAARASVHVAGWHVTPSFDLRRGPGARNVRELLGELAQRVEVRVLLWAGSPSPLYTPTRAQVRAVRDELVRGTRVRCELDSRERPMHCHHEKLVIVDGETAFVGGIDLTSLAGDRLDSSEHPRRIGLGWHDVAARVRGPAVADVAGHFAARWLETAGERLAVEPAPAAIDGGLPVQVARTVPERLYSFAPDGEFGILEAYTRALRSAQSLVYLESQFLWSPEIVAILADKLRRPPTPGFRLLVLLPARPNNGRDTTRGQLGVLADADAEGGGERFLAVTVASRTGTDAGPLYVHAKVGIVDDRWLTIGSANLNDHSLFNDTEVNVVSCEPQLARSVRLRLWAEHLELDEEEVAGEPARVFDERWRPIAEEQLARRRRGEAMTHRLHELPGVSRRSMALLGPLQGLLVDG